MKFLLFVAYLVEMVIEGVLFHKVMSPDSEQSFQEVLSDIIIVNLITLVIVVVLLGSVIATFNFNLALESSFRSAMIFLPQRLMKVLWVTVALDAIVITVLYRYKYPHIDSLTTFVKGAMMNVPALLITALLWIFTSLMNSFLNWIGM